MIGKVISTAVKLFLRSQVTQIEDLQLKITGRNRQIIQGCIPEVFLFCRHAVYRGLHLRQIELKAVNIGFNIKEVLKRKPLQLVEPISVDITLLLEAGDLQASLPSVLLSGGLKDFLYSLLSAKGIENPQEKLADYQIDWQTITLAEQKINLTGILKDSTSEVTQLKIAAGITLANPHTLALSPLEIVTIPPLPLDNCDRLEIDLGKSVAIAQLAVEDEKLLCAGQITVT